MLSGRDQVPIVATKGISGKDAATTRALKQTVGQAQAAVRHCRSLIFAEHAQCHGRRLPGFSHGQQLPVIAVQEALHFIDLGHDFTADRLGIRIVSGCPGDCTHPSRRIVTKCIHHALQCADATTGNGANKHLWKGYAIQRRGIDDIARTIAFEAVGNLVHTVFRYKNVLHHHILATRGLEAKHIPGMDDLIVFPGHQASQNPMQRNTAIFQDTYVGTREGERSKAIYAQSDFNLDQWVDGLKLIAGVRYTEDTIIRKNRDLLADGSCTADFADAYCVTKDDGKFRAFTGVLGVDYQLTADTLIYLTSRRGFRSGGFNITGALPNEQSYDPEYVIDLEAGIKSTLALGGAQLRWDAALYQQRYTDIQLPRFYADAHGRPVPVIENTGKARITGFELQSDLRLTSNLSLGMHFSWIDYDFTHLSSGVEKPIVTNIPKYKYGLNANYYLPVDPAHGEIRLSANWNWQDDSYISATDDPYALQKSYGLLNLDATWSRIAGQPVDVSLFMTNVNNKNYAIGGLPMSNLLGTSTLTYGEPRMWGVRIQYHFDP